MLIDCPACARSYHVTRAEIGEEGRIVICPRCDAQWFVDGDGTEGFDPAKAIDAKTVSRRPDSFDVGAAPEARPSIWRHSRPFAFAVGLAALMAAIGIRDRIVHLVPRTAGLYASIGLPVNARGLEIVALTTARAEASPSDLTVSGEIRAIAKKRVGVPRLTYEIRDKTGAPLVTWTESAAARTLGPGRTLPFVSAPHRLPPAGHTVLVRFEDEEPPTPIRLAHRPEH